MNEYAHLKHWLYSEYHIIVPNDWLQACLEWLHDEYSLFNVKHADPNAFNTNKLDVLKQLVFEQWLSADLRQLSIGCLPPNLIQAGKSVLQGPVCLQVESVVDVGTSFHSQLQKLKGTENSNAMVTAQQTPDAPPGNYLVFGHCQPKGHRMLMLSMTDGLNDVSAIEYATISHLPSHHTPGFKVCVTGSVTCRRGILLLRPDNLQVLGGEVDSLISTNNLLSTIEKTLSTEPKQFGQPIRKQFSGHMISCGGDNDFKDSKMIDSHANRQVPKYGGKSISSQTTCISTSVEFRHGTHSGNSEMIVPEDRGEKVSDASGDCLNDLDMMMDDEDDFLNSVDTKHLNILHQSIQVNINTEPSYVTNVNTGDANKNIFSRSTSVACVKPNNSQNLEDVLKFYDFDDADVRMPVIKRKYEGSGNDESIRQSLRVDSGKLKMPFDDIFSNYHHKATNSNTDNSSSYNLNYITNVVNEQESSSDITMHSNYGKQVQQKEAPHHINDDDFDDHVNASFIKTSTRHKEFTEISQNDDSLMREPYTYFILVENILTTNVGRVFRVKAYISTVLGRLNATDAGWSLPCRLNDGTATMDVQLSDTLLASMIGFTSQQSVDIRCFSSENPEAIQHLTKTIRACQQQFINFSRIFELKVLANYDILAMSIHQITRSHIDELKCRVSRMQFKEKY